MWLSGAAQPFTLSLNWGKAKQRKIKGKYETIQSSVKSMPLLLIIFDMPVAFQTRLRSTTICCCMKLAVAHFAAANHIVDSAAQ